MNQRLEQYWQQFRAIPRALQWGVIAVVAIVSFIIWNDYIKAIGDQWAYQADEIEADVREVRQSEQLRSRFQSLGSTIMSLGAVDVPQNEKETTDALNRIVNNILNQYRSAISNESFGRTAGDRLRKGSLTGILGANEIGQKLSGELEFDSSPETATAILRELETSPAIEAVSEVRISKMEQRTVNVKVKLEAWVVTPDPKRTL